MAQGRQRARKQVVIGVERRKESINVLKPEVEGEKLSLDLFVTKCGGQEVRAATLFLGGPHALTFCL